MADTPSDESLMLRYCDGDLAAFGELYRRHSGGLYRFLAWRSPRHAWVDEIMQDSWAALHGACASYRPQASFRTFLYQIARHRLIDLLRQHQLLLAGEMDATGAAFDALADAAQDVATPEMALDARQRQQALHAALAALPGVQKEALVLQQFCGMGLEEIGQVTGVPLETVKSRLRYAMRKLRQLPALGGQGDGE